VSKGNRYSVGEKKVKFPLKTLHKNIPLQHSIFHCLALCFSIDFWDRLFFNSSTTALRGYSLTYLGTLPSESLCSYRVIFYIFAGDALKFWSFISRLYWKGTRCNNSLNRAFQASVHVFPPNQTERRVNVLLFLQAAPFRYRTGSYCNKCAQKTTTASTFYLNICEHVYHDPNSKARYLAFAENWQWYYKIAQKHTTPGCAQ